MDTYENKISKKLKNPKNKNLNELIAKKRSLIPTEYWEMMPVQNWYKDTPRRKAYRSSKKYGVVKQVTLASQKNKCFCCGLDFDVAKITKYLHHLTYSNYFDEKIEDVIVVCEPCHGEGIHQIKKSLIADVDMILTNKVKTMNTDGLFNESKNADLFLDAIKLIYAFSHKIIDQVLTGKELTDEMVKRGMTDSFAQTVISILDSSGYMKHEKRGVRKTTPQFFDLCIGSEDKIRDLYNSWNASNTPERGLVTCSGTRRVANFDKINHSVMKAYCDKYGVKIDGLLSNSKKFREEKRVSQEKSHNRDARRVLSLLAKENGGLTLDQIKYDLKRATKKSKINDYFLESIPGIENCSGKFSLSNQVKSQEMKSEPPLHAQSKLNLLKLKLKKEEAEKEAKEIGMLLTLAEKYL